PTASLLSNVDGRSQWKIRSPATCGAPVRLLAQWAFLVPLGGVGGEGEFVLALDEIDDLSDIGAVARRPGGPVGFHGALGAADAFTHDLAQPLHRQAADLPAR